MICSRIHPSSLIICLVDQKHHSFIISTELTRDLMMSINCELKITMLMSK